MTPIPKLPVELWNLIYNMKRSMEYKDRWGWAGAISRGSRPLGLVGTGGPFRLINYDTPNWQALPVSLMLRRSAEWMWALRIFQLQYEITEQPWTWGRRSLMRMSNMPGPLLKAVRTKQDCISHIRALRLTARRSVGRLSGFTVGHIKPSVVRIYNENLKLLNMD
jgi:hypothetical protein